MAAREFEEGRGASEVKDGEIEIGIRISRIQFHGLAQFLLGNIRPSLPA
jgi:hypothetical protein